MPKVKYTVKELLAKMDNKIDANFTEVHTNLRAFNKRFEIC